MLPSALISASRPATLAGFTSPGLILPELRGPDAPSVLHELSQTLQLEGCVADGLQFYHAVLNREFVSSTVMECGMAFPHARLGCLKRLAFALGRAPAPLIWNSKESQTVRLVFLLAIPATDSTGYLNLISSLARMGKDAGLVKRLLAASDAFQIFSLLQQVPVRMIPAAQPAA